MSKTSLKSQIGGPNEGSHSLHNNSDFHRSRVGDVGVQFPSTPSAAACSVLRKSNLSAWPALSVATAAATTEVDGFYGLHQDGGAAQ